MIFYVNFISYLIWLTQRNFDFLYLQKHIINW